MADEHDKLLPIANVGRIMKQMLPSTAKISKESKETMQECASEFISFVTGEASEKCRRENRKTVNGDDICWALASLGFDDYSNSMVMYLNKFREFERERSATTTTSSSSVAPTPDRPAANQVKDVNVNEAAALGSSKHQSFV